MTDAFDEQVERLHENARMLHAKVAAVRALKRLRSLSRRAVVASEITGLTRLFTADNGYVAGAWIIPVTPATAAQKGAATPWPDSPLWWPGRRHFA